MTPVTAFGPPLHLASNSARLETISAFADLAVLFHCWKHRRGKNTSTYDRASAPRNMLLVFRRFDDLFRFLLFSDRLLGTACALINQGHPPMWFRISWRQRSSFLKITKRVGICRHFLRLLGQLHCDLIKKSGRT